jgi:hypothetical protein
MKEKENNKGQVDGKSLSIFPFTFHDFLITFAAAGQFRKCFCSFQGQHVMTKILRNKKNEMLYPLQILANAILQ